MDEQCGTCGGEGVLVGDAVDRRGERTDEVVACPDCTLDECADCGGDTGDDAPSPHACVAEPDVLRSPL